MRRQFLLAALAATLTFITLHFTLGPRYHYGYGWRGGYYWHGPFYGPPPGYYENDYYPHSYDRWYGPRERNQQNKNQKPVDSTADGKY